MKKFYFVFLTLCATLLTNAQNVGIGITTPVARLHVSDSNVVFTGPSIVPGSTTFNPPTQGAGTRMMWYPQKAAFRTGVVQSTQWDKDSIGRFSFAAGYNVKAKEDMSVAMGNGTTASGLSSTAIGYQSIASGLYSTSIGYQTLASNQGSIAMGYLTSSSGITSMAMGNGSTASGNYSTAMTAFSTASGAASIAAGFGATASGDYSVALGPSTIASGNSSTAMGTGTTASGGYTTAMGMFSSASGAGSTVVGMYNKAKSNNSLVIGTYNDTTATNRLFEIGNGTADNIRSNAMTVLQNGNVGINTISPIARLHVTDSNVVFTGPTTLSATTNFNPPAQGPGTRMMWYPQKAAFRSGFIDAEHWDKDSIGLYSFAVGFNSKARGEGSFASGEQTTASGQGSTAMGIGSIASWVFATALGGYTTASGHSSTAMGYFTTASGLASTAMGYGSIASGLSSTAMGDYTTASGSGSISMGGYTIASSSYSTAMGVGSIASGGYSTAMGYYTKAKSDYSLVIGKWNDTTNTNRVFEIGNGTTSVARSNAMTVLQNGNVGIGTSSPVTRLDIASTGNNWDLTGTEGDFRVGNGSYRIKMGVALDGGGAGAGRIRAAGGINTLYLGAGNTDVLTLFSTGNATLAGTLTQNSDARMKSNIQQLQSSLLNLQQLNGYTYNWIDESKDHSLQIGVLAQEIQKVYPQLVKQNDKGELSVNYTGLIPVLIEGMKEQQKQIEELKKQNAEIIKLLQQKN